MTAAPAINWHGIWAIYRYEMARALRTLWQSVATPVITTSLYFVVFGGAIGSRMQNVGGVDYGSFIVPALVMLSLLPPSISHASLGIYFPKFVGTVYKLLAAPELGRAPDSTPVTNALLVCSPLLEKKNISDLHHTI